MNSESSIKIDKLDTSNYHSWNIRVKDILTIRDILNFLHEDPPVTPSTPIDISLWHKTDENAQAIIGLSLPNDLLGNIRNLSTTKEMRTALWNVFEQHTLLYVLSTWKNLYPSIINSDELLSPVDDNMV